MDIPTTRFSSKSMPEVQYHVGDVGFGRTCCNTRARMKPARSTACGTARYARPGARSLSRSTSCSAPWPTQGFFHAARRAFSDRGAAACWCSSSLSFAAEFSPLWWLGAEAIRTLASCSGWHCLRCVQPCVLWRVWLCFPLLLVPSFVAVFSRAIAGRACFRCSSSVDEVLAVVGRLAT